MAATTGTIAIDPTARIADGAAIGPQVTIGPYCVIGPNVTIGEDCTLIAHVHVTGHTTVGPRTKVYPFASLGTPPQSVKYRGGPTRLEIGADCDIREHVTMNLGTEDGGGITRVGDRGFFMVGSHVGHDCDVGDDVILANNAVLGGHVTLGNRVVLGGGAAVHQFVRIGESAMVSGVCGVAADLIPFGFAIGQRAVLDGLNVVGMRRRGFSRADIHRLRSAYDVLFLGPGIFRDRLKRIEREFAGDELIGSVLAFIRAGDARPLMHPDLSGVSRDSAEAASANNAT
jgi:UDP-N-acetylglucosamine acyltransferase